MYSPSISNTSYAHVYRGCSALESLAISGTVYARSFSLADSPLISLASLQGIVGKAQAGSAAMTITVHPDVYAKLTDESNTEWHNILMDAMAKNISFATV